MRIKSRSTMVVGALLLLSSAGLLRAQQVAPGSAPIGDDKAKQEWISANPAAYKAAGGQISGYGSKKAEPVSVAEPSLVKGDQTPATAQMGMPWGAPENKEAWIAAHPTEYAAMNGRTYEYPWGDDANKAAWAAAHPAEFAAMNAVNTNPQPSTGQGNNHVINQK